MPHRPRTSGLHTKLCPQHGLHFSPGPVARSLGITLGTWKRTESCCLQAGSATLSSSARRGGGNPGTGRTQGDWTSEPRWRLTGARVSRVETVEVFSPTPHLPNSAFPDPSMHFTQMRPSEWCGGGEERGYPGSQLCLGTHLGDSGGRPFHRQLLCLVSRTEALPSACS